MRQQRAVIRLVLRSLLTILFCAVVVLAFLLGKGWEEWSQFARYGFGPPLLYTDQEVRTRIQQCGITIPDSARDLLYFQCGSVDPTVIMQMTIPHDLCQSIVTQWLTLERSQMRRMEISDFSAYTIPPGMIGGDLSKWNIMSFSKPIAYCAMPRALGRVAIYEQEGGRILLYSNAP